MCLLIIILLYLMNISINIFLRQLWCVLSFQVTFNVYNYDMTLIIRFYFLSLSDFLNELKFNHQVNKNTSTVVRVLSIQWHLNNKYIRTDRTSVLRTEGLGLIIECYLALEHINNICLQERCSVPLNLRLVGPTFLSMEMQQRNWQNV